MERALRWTVAATAAMVLAAAGMQPAFAQEEKREKTVTVEVKDGKVFINGQPADSTTTARMLRMDGTGRDGAEIVVDVDDADDERVIIRRRAGDGERAFTFRSGDRPMERIVERMHLGFPDRPDLEGMRMRVEREREAMAMEREIMAKAREVRRAEAADRARLEAELDELLAKAFDEKMARERAEAEAIAERLEALRSRIDKREAAREDIIARRKKAVLGEGDDLDW